jgi:hypothetical protein
MCIYLTLHSGKIITNNLFKQIYNIKLIMNVESIGIYTRK